MNNNNNNNNNNNYEIKYTYKDNTVHTTKIIAKTEQRAITKFNSKYGNCTISNISKIK